MVKKIIFDKTFFKLVYQNSFRSVDFLLKFFDFLFLLTHHNTSQKIKRRHLHKGICASLMKGPFLKSLMVPLENFIKFPGSTLPVKKLHFVKHILDNASGLVKFWRSFFGNWKKIFVESESKTNLYEITKGFPGKLLPKIDKFKITFNNKFSTFSYEFQEKKLNPSSKIHLTIKNMTRTITRQPTETF